MKSPRERYLYAKEKAEEALSAIAYIPATDDVTEELKSEMDQQLRDWIEFLDICARMRKS